MVLWQECQLQTADECWQPEGQKVENNLQFLFIRNRNNNILEEVATFLSLKKKWEFEKIFDSKQKVSSKYISLLTLPSNLYRIGIAVPKRLGKAVLRNLNKRQIKNVICKNNLSLKKHQGVLVVKHTFIELNFKQKEFEIIKIFKIWHEKHQRELKTKF